MPESTHRFVLILTVVVLILIMGTIGFVVLEGWAWLDSFYMAIITITTVGFGEVHPLTPVGRLFTSLLALLGVGVMTYTFGTLTNYLVVGQLRGFLEERKMQKTIRSLSGHYIVCGYGRVGQQVCRELSREGYPLVVIDSDEASAAQARERGYLVVQGDAGQDHVLLEAGIERARPAPIWTPPW